jgi:hypothetical protein
MMLSRIIVFMTENGRTVALLKMMVMSHSLSNVLSNPLVFAVAISIIFIKRGIIVVFTRKILTLTTFLLPKLMFVCLTAGVVAQQLDNRVLFEIEIDKTVYFNDERLFLLMRIENLSNEVLTIVPMMGQKNEAERDHCPSVTSLTSGQVYPINQHPWKTRWDLKPGDITYHIVTFDLEYRHPEMILAPLPAGEYAMEVELHVTGTTNSSYSMNQRQEFAVKSIDENLPPNTFGQSETMRHYYEKVKMRIDTSEWNAEIRRLLGSSEVSPYRNTIICKHFNTSMDLNSGPQGTINAIQKSIDIALKRPDDILPLVLLGYGRRDRQFDYLYCERFPEVAATGETRLHRYFREFVCKQK